MARLQDLVYGPIPPRSVLVRLPTSHPTSILHSLAVISHVAKHTTKSQVESEGDGTQEHKGDLSPSSPPTFEAVSFARDTWQRAMLNMAFLRFTSIAQAKAAQNLPPEACRFQLPPISPSSSSFLNKAGTPSSVKEKGVTTKPGHARSFENESPLRRILRETAPLRGKEYPFTVDKLEYAGLSDVAPFLGLQLPCSITGISESDGDRTGIEDEKAAGKGTEKVHEETRWCEIEVVGRDWYEPPQDLDGSDRQRRTHQDAFKAWRGISRFAQKGTVESSDSSKDGKVGTDAQI